MTKTPHIIYHNGIEYQLGKIKNKIIHYNFTTILQFLNAKGKTLFTNKFKIYHEDLEIIYKLCCYTIQDHNTCKKHKIDINKGILLTGPVGCGKTTLMKLIRHIIPHKRQYQIIPCRNTVFSFNHIGFKTIEDYGSQGYFCFDDLGVEPTGRHYGKDCNVMGEILLSRYDLFCHPERSRRVKTHCTTNLNAKELEERYGNRARSRMRQMFNLIAFNKKSKDKRI